MQERVLHYNTEYYALLSVRYGLLRVVTCDTHATRRSSNVQTLGRLAKGALAANLE